ncbi:hypothetical protein [Desulfosporosinus burensis]
MPFFGVAGDGRCLRHVHDRRSQAKLVTQARLQTGRNTCVPAKATAARYAIPGAPCTRHVLCRRPCRMAGFAHPCAQPFFPGRFREVWRAARFSRSLCLKQRLS